MTLLYIIKGDRMRLTWNEVTLISIGGIIRGAIAFGLSFGIHTTNNRVLKNKVQIVVLTTTIVLGSTMGIIAKILNIRPD